MRDAKPDIALAESLFDSLRRATAHGGGVTRDAYGKGEQIAHEIVRAAAERLDLRVQVDGAGNSYMTLPGRNPAAKAIVIGSHLDSVPEGGNYDGAAGVISGLSAASGLIQSGVRLEQDLTVMAIRAEEGVWFPYSYVGSRMALGQLDPTLLDTLKRSDTNRPLAAHMEDLGLDVARIRKREAFLSADRVAAFIEPHIEQGPVLEHKGVPVGIVTSIRGNLRYRRARCVGTYGHSGAVPRLLRSDAVSAVAELVCQMNKLWARYETDQHDLSVTFGKFSTDPAVHGFSRIAGEVEFAIDLRSQDTETLQLVHATFKVMLDAAQKKHGVNFELADFSEAAPAVMDSRLRHILSGVASNANIPFIEIPSGAGHDAALFASCGIPTAMIFIRNAHGSHNPCESMSLGDFAAATQILLNFLIS